MSPEAAESLRSLDLLAHPTHVGSSGERFELRAPELNDDERRTWEGQIRGLLSACGCEAGRMAVGTAVGGYVAYVVLAPAAAPSGWHAWAVGGALAALAAIVGKVAGILRAKSRLRRLISQLRARLDAPRRHLPVWELAH